MDESYELMGSLIPANGWRAVYAYKGKDHHGCERWAHARPLVAFALTKVIFKPDNDEMTRIVGYVNGDGAISAVEQMGNFIAYLGPNEPMPDWLEEEAKKFWRK